MVGDQEHRGPEDPAEDPAEEPAGDTHWHPEWRPHPLPGVCERCGSVEHVHDGLCRKCRDLLLGEGVPAEPEHEERPPRDPELEPLHNPPWRRKGA